jgi:hypothetical protein
MEPGACSMSNTANAPRSPIAVPEEYELLWYPQNSEYDIALPRYPWLRPMKLV